MHPRQLRFDFALWTSDMIPVLTRDRFGVEMSRQGVSDLLRRIGLSPPRRLIRTYEQDREAAEHWKANEYPKIAAAAKDARAQIFFYDEPGVRTDHQAGTTRADIGNTPIVRGTGQRRSLNMISAVPPKGKLHFAFAERVELAASSSTCSCSCTTRRARSSRLGGDSAHKSTMTKNLVASTRRIPTLFYLPPHSPAFNPDEWVWCNIKHDRVGKMAARSLEDMKVGIENAVERLQTPPRDHPQLFPTPDLSYINA